MKGNLTALKKYIDREVDKLSKFKISGKRLSKFDNSLLRTDNEDLIEHIDSQASGVLYYEMMLQRVKEKVQKIKNIYNNLWDTEYRKSKNSLSGKEGKVTINDIESHARKKTKIKDAKEKVEEWKNIEATLAIWVKAWVTKGFSLSELNRQKFGTPIDENKMESVRKKVKKGMGD